jgi:hypothetical protein
VGGGRTNIYNIWKGFGEDEKGKKEIDCSSLYFSERVAYIRGGQFFRVHGPIQ